MIPKYSDIEKQIRTVEYPIKKGIVYAYKDGEAKPFETYAEARKYSSNTETVQVDKEEYAAQLKQYTDEFVLVIYASFHG